MLSSMPKHIELLTKQLAAEALGLSVRRIMELSAEGLLTRHRALDPATKREAVMFDVREIERMKQSAAAAPSPLLLGPGAAAAAIESEENYDAPLRLWLTLSQAAEYSGLPASVLSRFIDQGRLPAIDVGVRPGGHWRVRQLDLDAIEGDRRK
jgi:excisionase family DNA binding protein